MRITLVTLIFIISIIPTIGQDTITVDNKDFLFKSAKYDLSNIEGILTQKEASNIAYQNYKLGVKNRNAQLLTGLVLFIGEGIMTPIGIIDGLENGNEALAYIGLGSFVLGSGILVSLKPKKHLLIDAIDIYNKEVMTQKEIGKLEIKPANSGIGLVYSF